jgi:hypothetical protein
VKFRPDVEAINPKKHAVYTTCPRCGNPHVEEQRKIVVLCGDTWYLDPVAMPSVQEETTESKPVERPVEPVK